MASFPRRHPLGFLFLLVGIPALIVGGYFLWTYFESYESTDDAWVNANLSIRWWSATSKSTTMS